MTEDRSESPYLFEQRRGSYLLRRHSPSRPRSRMCIEHSRHELPFHEDEDEHYDEDEKNQIRFHAYTLHPFSPSSICRYVLHRALSRAPFLIFRIPHSNFRLPVTSLRQIKLLQYLFS
jgi:hypothetical protein